MSQGLAWEGRSKDGWFLGKELECWVRRTWGRSALPDHRAAREPARLSSTSRGRTAEEART